MCVHVPVSIFRHCINAARVQWQGAIFNNAYVSLRNKNNSPLFSPERQCSFCSSGTAVYFEIDHIIYYAQPNLLNNSPSYTFNSEYIHITLPNRNCIYNQWFTQRMYRVLPAETSSLHLAGVRAVRCSLILGSDRNHKWTAIIDRLYGQQFKRISR